MQRRDQVRRDDLQGSRRGIHRARQGLQRRLHRAGHRRWREHQARRRATCAPASRWCFRRRRSQASTIFPDLDQYQGLPLEFGRMEPTRVRSERDGADGHARRHARRRPDQRARDAEHSRRALRHLQGRSSTRIRRRVRCRRARRPCARSSASSPTRSSAPPSSTRKYGSNPDLAALPMYCVVAAFKDPVRHEGHAHDVEQRRELRDGRAAGRLDDRRAAARQGRDHLREVERARIQRRARRSGRCRRRRSATGWPAARWKARGAVSPATRTTPSASCAARAAAPAPRSARNLAMIGICEQSGASCQGPASRNGTALILTTKGIIARQRRHRQSVVQRPRRHSRPHARGRRAGARCGEGSRCTATTIRAIRSPHCRRALIPEQPYASFVVGDDARARTARSRSQGMRIAILREHMVKKTKNHEAISDQIDAEIKSGAARPARRRARRDRRRRSYADDPSRAERDVHASPTRCPRSCRGSCRRCSRGATTKGELFFAVPGHDVTSYDYLLKRQQARGAADRRRGHHELRQLRAPCRATAACAATSRSTSIVISRRAATRASRTGRPGSRTRSSARTSRRRARRTGSRWKDHTDAGKADRVARSYVARLALHRMMYENDIDAFVHAENTVPTPKIQGPNVGTSSLDGISPFFQIPRIAVPAGVTDVIYEPQYALTRTRRTTCRCCRAGTHEDEAAARDADLASRSSRAKATSRR